MKKIYPIIVVVALIPQITFAAWWNPISWNWKSLFSPPSKNIFNYSVTATTTSTATDLKNNIPGSNVDESSSRVQNRATNIRAAIKPSVQPQTVVPEPELKAAHYCNGVAYSECPTGTQFVCGSVKGACGSTDTQQSSDNTLLQQYLQQQVNAQQEAQQKADERRIITNQYDIKLQYLEQQIQQIKSQYQIDLNNLAHSGVDQSSYNGQAQKLTDQDNQKIENLQYQEQQLYLDYSGKLNNL